MCVFRSICMWVSVYRLVSKSIFINFNKHFLRLLIILTQTNMNMIIKRKQNPLSYVPTRPKSPESKKLRITSTDEVLRPIRPSVILPVVHEAVTIMYLMITILARYLMNMGVKEAIKRTGIDYSHRKRPLYHLRGRQHPRVCLLDWSGVESQRSGADYYPPAWPALATLYVTHKLDALPLFLGI